MYFVSAFCYALCLCLCSIVTAESKESHKHSHIRKPVRAANPSLPESVSRDLIHGFERYAHYVSAAYRRETGPCPHPPLKSVLVDFLNITSTSTQGVLFRHDKHKELIYAFPGTSSHRDRITDFENALAPLNIRGISAKQCKNCKVYKGVQEAWQSITNRSMKVLDHELKKYPSYKITITGHSLGAAIAFMATAGLRGLKYPVKKTVTFGQPRVGNAEMADYMDKINNATELVAGNYYRVVRC